MKTKSISRPRSRQLLLVAGLMVCAFANAAEFGASVWRGETAYVEIPEGFQAKASALAAQPAKDGVSLTLLRFDEVKYDIMSELKKNKKNRDYREILGKASVADVCREWKPGDAAKPTMIKIVAAPDAKPVKRLVGLDPSGENGDKFVLTVVDRVLPPAKDWKYFLDLWQHPWAVSRYFKVEPFSKEHYAKMEPIWRALADCGCKALTVTLLDLPWNHQCYDGYYAMIGRVKKSDGTWAFDYKIFDEYVEFGLKCGLGPDIACYSMCPWGYRMTWKEEGPGVSSQGLVEKREKMLPGTPEPDRKTGRRRS